MIEENIVEFCAPTLAGIKTANLFTCTYNEKSEILKDIRRVNKLLAKRGIKALPARYSNHRVLIYVYRTSFLEKDLCDKDTSNILAEFGYETGNVNSCINCLISKLSSFTDSCGFPHEIGCFLGYPPEDVRGFMKSMTNLLEK